MNIKAWCPKCNWVGMAIVGRGVSIEDYKCPKCGNDVKRPYRGRYTWGAEKAILMTVEEKYRTKKEK